MTSDSMMLEQSTDDGSSILSETKVSKYQLSTVVKSHFDVTEHDSKKRGNSPLAETRPAKRPKSSEIKKSTSIALNNILSFLPKQPEFEIEKTRFEVFSHFMDMKLKMDEDYRVMTKKMKIWTRGGLANNSSGKSPANQYFINSLVSNFEEIIGNIGEESKRDVDRNMDEIRKILVKLVYKIERSFKPIPLIDAIKVTRRDTDHFLWLGLWSLVAVFTVVFPDYLLKYFESAVAFYDSTILIVFLLCMLYFYNPSSK